MNKVQLIGRLTKDPDIRYTQGNNPMCVARFTLAVDRRYKKEGEQTADFIPCIVFGKSAEFTEKYFKKGMRVAVSGRIQTGSYTNRDGQKVYTTDVVVEEQEFCENRQQNGQKRTDEPKPSEEPQQTPYDGFMSIPDGIDAELPFN